MERIWLIQIGNLDLGHPKVLCYSHFKKLLSSDGDWDWAWDWGWGWGWELGMGMESTPTPSPRR